MEFGPVPPASAIGAILAHSMRIDGRRWPKGHVLTAADAVALQAAGVAEVTVARLDLAQDLAEDAAAARLAAALVPDPGAAGLTVAGAATGRVNLHAARVGVLEYAVDAVHALNRVDPAITLATLAPHARVGPRTLAGTVKIITYGVTASAVEAACAAARAARLRVAPVIHATAGLLLSHVPGQADALNLKGRAVTQARLAALGMALADVAEAAHSVDPMARALRGLAGDMVLILTGSATSDLRDVAPEAVRAAGGRVERFGMPVDPGNLLFIGSLGGRPVIGLPGCARSIAPNGADWVLERLACGIPVGPAEIAAMGVGGLLKEPRERPHPREGARRRAAGDAGPDTPATGPDGTRAETG